MTFLRELLAVILGVFIAGFFMFFVMIGIGSAMSSSMFEEDKVMVKKNTVLRLNLSEAVKDYVPKDSNPFSDIFDLKDDLLGLNELINAIDNAKYDNNILGISIEVSNLNAGISQTKALRDKLEDFKESGKFITAYADVYSQQNYYLSTVADSIYVNPVGQIGLRGLASEILYYKDFQDKYGVKMEVVRHGKFKSAVEPFLFNAMSDANKEQIGSFLNSIWVEIAEAIAQSRDKTVEEVNYIADELLARTPDLAIENGMITNKLFKDEYLDVLEELSGLDASAKIYALNIGDYIKSGKGRIFNSSKNKIAVVYAQGEIMYGKGSESIIGQEVVCETLDKLKKDDNVKAVVLRVNSPGGSALASDIIWREIDLLKKEKPVVVSMGDYAASGGYYIACNATEIIAEPTTITGSIGVFSMYPNMSGLADNIGINAEQIGTNKQSVGYSLFEPMTEDFYKISQEGIANVYDTFVNRIMAGRGMTYEEVDAIAQGRVWSGTEALKLGLIDELGGLDVAIEAAADLADLNEYAVRNYPNFEKELKDLFGSPFSIKANTIIKEELGSKYYKAFERMKRLSQLEGVQARMPFEMTIK